MSKQDEFPIGANNTKEGQKARLEKILKEKRERAI